MNGGWGEWTDWSKCTVECGGGNQTKTRKCDNPPASGGGIPCEGIIATTRECNIHHCPSKSECLFRFLGRLAFLCWLVFVRSLVAGFCTEKEL